MQIVADMSQTPLQHWAFDRQSSYFGRHFRHFFASPQKRPAQHAVVVHEPSSAVQVPESPDDEDVVASAPASVPPLDDDDDVDDDVELAPPASARVSLVYPSRSTVIEHAATRAAPTRARSATRTASAYHRAVVTSTPSRFVPVLSRSHPAKASPFTW